MYPSTPFAVWADGTYCELDDVAEYSHMSDDYHIVHVPDDVLADLENDEQLFDYLHDLPF